MAIFKCKMCGGSLEITEGQSVCTCEFCGTEQTLPRLDSDRKANLYDRANHFRRNNDFDKAMGIYEQILNEDNTDAEAYWSLVLCRYGIEYVEDPATHKRIPTINRAQYTSVYADENYKSALQYAGIAQKIVYEQEAKTIDEIQKGILAISEKEEPFDVFICYKETDDTGRRTPDSVLANDLYHQLTQEGFKVFFARITLEDKLGQEYEPYIFAALNSAKVMVVLGTKPEYFKAVWVKNEWSRYLALIRSGEKKMLIPAYKDMDPYDLPEEFSHLQAQDMTKLGFMQDLIRGIKKILGAEQQQSVPKETVVVQQGGGSGNSDALIKRGNMALEDGEWQKADEFFEEVLNQNPECAEAYLGKLMAKMEKSNIASLTKYYVEKYESSRTEKLDAYVKETEEIEKAVTQYAVKGILEGSEIRKLYVFDRGYTSELSFRKEQKTKELSELSNEKLLVRAKQYAAGDVKASLDKMISEITAVLDGRIAKAQKEDDEKIYSIYHAYLEHLEKTGSMVKDLYEKRMENIYTSKVEQMDAARTIGDFERVRDFFNNMNGYKDTLSLADKCQKEIYRLEEEMRLEYERRKKEAEIRARKKKVINITIVSIVAVCIIIFLVITKVIIPNNDYNRALELANSGQYLEAISMFEELDGYKDSIYQIEQNSILLLTHATVGDTVRFGNYNGNTRWIVLDEEDGKLLLLSAYAIEKRQYQEEKGNITWENCTLRSWLNSSYISTSYFNTAFNADEQEIIINSNIKNGDNTLYNTDGGNDTTDQVFLLSIDEAREYFLSDSDREGTLADGTSVRWWLRSPGRGNNKAAFIDKDGSICEGGTITYTEKVGVRPALWVDVSAY